VTALLIVRDDAGDIIGQCDQKRYEAEHDRCICICQGENHGKGRQRAEGNTRDGYEPWVESARATGWNISSFELGEAVTAEPLFELGEAV
jgi:hypothetical protein